MKKILLFASFFFIFTNYAHEHGVMLALKQGFFIPQEKTLRTMFDCCGSKGGYFVEGALRYNVWDCLYLELNGSYFGRKGRSVISTTDNSSDSCCNECGERISFKMPTIGFGIKYFYWFHDCISFYAGGGIKGFFVNIKNDSDYVPRCDKQNTVGGFIHTGLLFDVYKGLFIELFADYLGAKLKCPRSNADLIGYKLNVGGFAGGLGIGYSF